MLFNRALHILYFNIHVHYIMTDSSSQHYTSSMCTCNTLLNTADAQYGNATHIPSYLCVCMLHDHLTHNKMQSSALRTKYEL